MKKEISVFLQFILILQLTGWAYFVLLVFQDKTILSFWGEHRELILNWTLAFIVLGFFRLTAFYIFSRNKTIAFSQFEKSGTVRDEISKTIQYCLLGLISALASYEIFVFRVNPMVNMQEIWLNFQPMFFAWLIGYFILSILRLGVIYKLNRKNA